MVDSDKVFAGSIPELYDRFLGPLIFQPYAEDLAARLAASKNSKVLETAAGTGVLTRVLVEHLPTGVEITATDLNQPMIERATSERGAVLTERQRYGEDTLLRLFPGSSLLRLLWSLFLFLLILLPAEVSQAAKKDMVFGQGVLWKVEREGTFPSYVFGTMHVGDIGLFHSRIVDRIGPSAVVAGSAETGRVFLGTGTGALSRDSTTTRSFRRDCRFHRLDREAPEWGS